MLRELVPIATTIAMIINPNNPAAEADTMEVQAAAQAVGVQLQLLKASTECGIDSCSYRKPHPASEQSRIGRCSFPMIDFLRLLACALTRLFRSRTRLEAEILVLRHQLNVLRRKAPKRVALSSIDRLVFAGLYRLAPGVLDALKILKPETVIRWHRAGFRAYWRLKSSARGGRPKTPGEIRELIRDMSVANPLWGAPRIHGELLMLGIDIGQTTVAKYMVRQRRPPSQGWKTFFRNHTDGIASMDLLVVPTISFRLLYGFLILRHSRRDILWLGVTARPNAEWIARQLTEAYGWQHAPQYIVRDRDRVYGDAFIRRLRAMGIRDRPIAPRSPWQNGHTERLIGSIRRDCLDHVVVFGERHLRHLLGSYQRYYNDARTHLSLNKDAPASRAVQAVGRIVANPHLGGLHHQYVRI
jgi:transposase InsO family protein